jgi:hypothetical protein
MKKIFFAIACAFVLSGCSHNIYVRGVGIATPYGAFGYGDFSCVKDNVEVESAETVGLDGKAETKHKFKVGKQTTGYDVDIAKVKNKK